MNIFQIAKKVTVFEWGKFQTLIDGLVFEDNFHPARKLLK
jgi:hypothetical protein